MEIEELKAHHKQLLSTYSNNLEKFKKHNIDSGKCECGGCGILIEYSYFESDRVSRITEYAIPCKCAGGIDAERKRIFSGIPTEFEGLTLKNFNLELYESEEAKYIATEALRKATLYVKNYRDMRFQIEKTKGLYLYSNKRGSGKTRLAASIANNLISREGLDVIFITSIDLLAKIRACYSKDSDKSDEQIIEKFNTVSVLVIDDIGAEKSSNFVDEIFFRILDTRMKHYRTTIFTSNLSRNDQKYEERISDRLRKMTVEIKLPEESVRSKLGQREEEDFFARLEGK